MLVIVKHFPQVEALVAPTWQEAAEFTGLSVEAIAGAFHGNGINTLLFNTQAGKGVIVAGQHPRLLWNFGAKGEPDKVVAQIHALLADLIREAQQKGDLPALSEDHPANEDPEALAEVITSAAVEVFLKSEDGGSWEVHVDLGLRPAKYAALLREATRRFTGEPVAANAVIVYSA